MCAEGVQVSGTPRRPMRKQVWAYLRTGGREGSWQPQCGGPVCLLKSPRDQYQVLYGGTTSSSVRGGLWGWRGRTGGGQERESRDTFRRQNSQDGGLSEEGGQQRCLQ